MWSCWPSCLLSDRLGSGFSGILPIPVYAAPRLGVSLSAFEARTPDDLPRAIAALRSSNVVGFILLNEPTQLARRNTITVAATTHRLPGIYTMSLYTEAGGLM